MAQPILDLSTLIADRPQIRIDGTTYHLKSPEEITLAESYKFSRWGRELEALGKEPDKLAELEGLLELVAWDATADVPRPVFDKLSPSQHLSIVEVFTMLLLGRRSRLAGAGAAALVGDRSTGRKSSRASSAPTAASRDGGSTEPRRHS